MSKIYSVIFAGQAGQGIKSAGCAFAKILTRSGFYTYDYTEYPSLIRGGHNVISIAFSKDPVYSPIKKSNVLVALNQESIDLHKNYLVEGGLAIYDKDLDNITTLGVLCYVFSININLALEVISETFSLKEQKIIAINKESLKKGYIYAQDKKIKQIYLDSDHKSPTLKIVLNGNQAVAYSAICSDLQFCAIYPMSPVSEIMHILAEKSEKEKFVFVQAEDEISAINMAIGASFAGARSMTSTSGGGFCLMTEGLGLSAMTETPLVIIEGSRGGPATGLPTWSGQGDLQFVLHAHQGDFPRIVLAPGDALETFYLTNKAFNLADQYQIPVIILMDKNLCENGQSFDLPKESALKVDRGETSMVQVGEFKRYLLTKTGISPRSFPGTGNFFIANSDEHDEMGFSNEEAKNRDSQMNKRMRKITTCEKEDMEDPQIFGPVSAKNTIVSFGSNKGSIIEALKELPDTNYLHITWMNPFPSEFVKKHLEKCQNIIAIECNYDGQLANLIKEKIGIEITNRILKTDGRIFYPEDIVEEVKKLI